MEPLLLVSSKKVNQWNNGYISPGPVAAVGDALVNVRLKQSAPELPMRFQYDKNRIEQMGMNVQDGTLPSYTTEGLGAVSDIKNYYNQPFDRKTVGFVKQDLRYNDLTATTRLIEKPQEKWKIQSATTINAKVTGNQFLPLPNGYIQQGVPRGTGLYHSFISNPDYTIIKEPTVEEPSPGVVGPPTDGDSKDVDDQRRCINLRPR